MTCEEMIYSEEYADLLVNFLPESAAETDYFENGCVNPIIDKIAIAHLPLQVDYMTNLESIPYSFIPKLYGLMDSTNLDSVGVTKVQLETGLGLDGENVIVGVVDTGAIVKIMFWSLFYYMI